MGGEEGHPPVLAKNRALRSPRVNENLDFQTLREIWVSAHPRFVICGLLTKCALFCPISAVFLIANHVFAKTPSNLLTRCVN